MAGLYHYKCTECDFEVYSTPWGGDVWGSGYGYHLYCCEDCKKLTKIEQEFNGRARIKEKLIIGSMLINSEESSKTDPSNKCSYCGSTKLIRWVPANGICPMCKGALLESDEPVIQTD